MRKDIEEFPLRSRFTKLRQSYCKDCRKLYGAEWYANNKEYQKANSRKHSIVYRDNIREYLWNYLLSHPCEGILPDGRRCQERDPVVLEFHHLYGKDMAIAEMVSRTTNIEKIEEELAKCQVLCASCHRRVTAKKRGWFRSQK